MSEPFIAEVRIFACNFAPRGWAFCNGALLPVAQNTALFSLLGTTYGGNGRTNFGLPNLGDRAPMHPGNGPGLSPRRLGQTGGAAAVTLTENQLGSHTHSVPATTEAPNSNSPTGALPAMAPVYNNGSVATDMSAGAIAPAGGGQAHDNVQPLLALNFVIAIQGLYPSRN